MNPEQKDRRKKLRSFALAVADPTSPTYGNAVDSYLFAFDLDKAGIEAAGGLQSVVRTAHRARHLPYVLKCIEAIQAKIQSAVGLSLPEYMQLLLARESYFAKRGIPGDAAASAKILHDVGKAAGHLSDKIKDDPEKEKQLMSGEEIVARLLEYSDRIRRLQQANPLPALPASAEIIVEEPNGKE